MRGVRGQLGVPIADPVRVTPDVLRSRFAHGHIDWNTETGVLDVVVR
jgi:uncharacterized protein with LGFP repeats